MEIRSRGALWRPNSVNRGAQSCGNRAIHQRQAAQDSRLEPFATTKFGYATESAERSTEEHESVKPFLWKKKLERDGIRVEELSPTEARKLMKRKVEENRSELEKVKRRRTELEQCKFDAQIEREQLLREWDTENEWEMEEERFLLRQTQLRSKLRLQRGRAKAIDQLARYAWVVYAPPFHDHPAEMQSCHEYFLDADRTELEDPSYYFAALGADDLTDLLEGVMVYQRVHKNLTRLSEFWLNMKIVVEYELEKHFDKPDDEEHAVPSTVKQTDSSQNPRNSIHDQVEPYVLSIVENKFVSELKLLQKALQKKLAVHDPLAACGVDVSYWERVMYHVRAHIASRQLVEDHAKYLIRALDGVSSALDNGRSPKIRPTPDDAPNTSLACKEKADPGSMPIRGSSSENESLSLPPLLTVDLTKPPNVGLLASHTGPHDVISDCACASDYEDDPRFRPRKPEYCNKVHTGYQWNRYNRSHYDKDSPPPKTVTGYKFNIYYPDLIDKTKLPTFTITRQTEGDPIAIVRFHSGPPYEDVAFRIVHKEWDCSWKRGFRCQFNRGVFELWFSFKRMVYRR